jgi:hypothetical protein
MIARVEVQEIDPDNWSGCGNTLPHLRFRRVVADDGHTPEVRQHLRELRARGVKVGPLLGDELDHQPGDTLRGVPAGFTHPALCGARTKANHPCRALKVKGRKRCKWHGGLSTGPRTAEGKARCTRNLPWARKQTS